MKQVHIFNVHRYKKSYSSTNHQYDSRSSVKGKSFNRNEENKYYIVSVSYSISKGLNKSI
jgi:hypothetical protein